MRFLFFTQQTCIPCKQVKPILEHVAKIVGLEIEYVDVTYNWDYCDMFGVKSTPAIFLVNVTEDYEYDVIKEIKSRTAVSILKEVSL